MDRQVLWPHINRDLSLSNSQHHAPTHRRSRERRLPLHSLIQPIHGSLPPRPHQRKNLLRNTFDILQQLCLRRFLRRPRRSSRQQLKYSNWPRSIINYLNKKGYGHDLVMDQYTIEPVSDAAANVRVAWRIRPRNGEPGWIWKTFYGYRWYQDVGQPPSEALIREQSERGTKGTG
jgi:hypothetical protein